MHRGNGWNVRVIGVLVATGCVLSACTGTVGGEPAPVSPSAVASPPEVPPSPSPTPTPTPSPPKLPKGAEEDSTAGAKKVIQHFFDLRRYAFVTGDSRPLGAVSMDSCDYCDSSIARGKELGEEGSTIEGAEIRISSVQYEGSTKLGAAAYSFKLLQRPWRVLAGDGVETDVNDEDLTYRGTIAFLREGDTFRVEEVDIMDGQSS